MIKSGSAYVRYYGLFRDSDGVEFTGSCVSNFPCVSGNFVPDVSSFDANGFVRVSSASIVQIYSEDILG